MNRNQTLVVGLALTLIVVWIGGVCLSQDKPENPQDGPRTSTIDGLWRQMGLLQRQIVGLEVGHANPRRTPRLELLPGNIALGLSDNALPKTSEGNSRDVQKPTPTPKTVPTLEKPPKLGDSTNEAKIDQLWRQITDLQKSILKLEIADMNPRLLATATLTGNGTDRIEKLDTASERISDGHSGKGPNRESPQKTIPGFENPVQPRGGSNEAHIAQLWQQIGQLYRQIVALEVGDTRSH